MKIAVWLVIPDLHFPYHDLKYVKVVTALIRILKVRHGANFRGVIQLGDFGDFWQLSDYDRDPSRQANVLDDLLAYSAQLDLWEKELPEGASYYQLEGNHEDRLRRYIWRKAPDLLKLVKSFPEVLRFAERNKRGHVAFKWFPLSDWRGCKIGDTVFHHGHFYNKHVAVGNLDRYPTKLVTGHTHRVQFASNGERWSASLGHGSNENDTSHNPVPANWQQAFGVFTSVNNVGSLEVVLVNDGVAAFRGEVLKV